MKFQKGDRVKVARYGGSTEGPPIDFEGLVIGFANEYIRVLVKETDWLCREDELELVVAHKFQAGDRVRVLKQTFTSRDTAEPGDLGTVAKIETWGQSSVVVDGKLGSSVNEDGRIYFSEGDLEPASVVEGCRIRIVKLPADYDGNAKVGDVGTVAYLADDLPYPIQADIDGGERNVLLALDEVQVIETPEPEPETLASGTRVRVTELASPDISAKPGMLGEILHAVHPVEGARGDLMYKVQLDGFSHEHQLLPTEIEVVEAPRIGDVITSYGSLGVDSRWVDAVVTEVKDGKFFARRFGGLVGGFNIGNEKFPVTWETPEAPVEQDGGLVYDGCSKLDADGNPRGPEWIFVPPLPQEAFAVSSIKLEIGEKAEEEPTIKQLLDQIAYRIENQKSATDVGSAAREFSLALTALEDATMRYTRGVAKREGFFHGGIDPDRFVEEASA
jgi:hypothetical protein